MYNRATDSCVMRMYAPRCVTCPCAMLYVYIHLELVDISRKILNP